MTDDPNTTTTAHSTNGRARVERSILEPRKTIESRTRRRGIGRLIIPAAIIVGAVLVVRRRDRTDA